MLEVIIMYMNNSKDHIHRTDEDRWPQRAQKCKPVGRGTRDRPQRHWKKDFLAETRQYF
jgi:hypothetical protein